MVYTLQSTQRWGGGGGATRTSESTTNLTARLLSDNRVRLPPAAFLGRK